MFHGFPRADFGFIVKSTGSEYRPRKFHFIPLQERKKEEKINVSLRPIPIRFSFHSESNVKKEENERLRRRSHELREPSVPVSVGPSCPIRSAFGPFTPRPKNRTGCRRRPRTDARRRRGRADRFVSLPSARPRFAPPRRRLGEQCVAEWFTYGRTSAGSVGPIRSRDRRRMVSTAKVTYTLPDDNYYYYYNNYSFSSFQN